MSQAKTSVSSPRAPVSLQSGGPPSEDYICDLDLNFDFRFEQEMRLLGQSSGARPPVPQPSQTTVRRHAGLLEPKSPKARSQSRRAARKVRFAAEVDEKAASERQAAGALRQQEQTAKVQQKEDNAISAERRAEMGGKREAERRALEKQEIERMARAEENATMAELAETPLTEDDLEPLAWTDLSPGLLLGFATTALALLR